MVSDVFNKRLRQTNVNEILLNIPVKQYILNK